ncbi:MAG: sigma-54 dependent transcriptional regulator [Desulfonauticus sp.]|nr:sigma-54 dependent transcriptional regulator [Desulfonauticus sp.]
MEHSKINIIVVDDEKDFVDGLCRILERKFFCKCIKSYSAEQALEFIKNSPEGVDVVITDLRMPGLDGIELIQKLKLIKEDITSIVLTAYGSIESAVEAVKSGAYDFLTKPIDMEQLNLVLNKVLEKVTILKENKKLKQKILSLSFDKELVGNTLVMQRLKEKISAIAKTDFTVLIRGESGTGKELVARKIYELSSRNNYPFISVNCPAIPETLLESELFGHKKGAFTGADKDREGLFKQAHKGTILLDEIGDISLSVQTKLLRVLQEKEIRPVGANTTLKCDVRILATTNQNLEVKIKKGLFREDLFYRLNVMEIVVPPLRERREDIPLLATYFVTLTCKELGLEDKEIAPEVLAYLTSKEWPGNVRELQNFVRRLVVFSSEKKIGIETVQLLEMDELIMEKDIKPYKVCKKQIVDSFTRTYFLKVLEKTKGNISEAARLSGIERVSLQKIIKRLGLHVSR